MSIVRSGAWLALGSASAAVLTRGAPDWGGLRAGLAAPTDWVQSAGGSAAAAELARAVLWLAAAWLTLALVATALPLLPGLAGRIGVCVADALVPAVLRRVLAGGAGLGVVLAPAAALAAAPTPPPAAPVPITSCSDLPAPVWPVPSTDPALPEPPSTAGAPGPGAARRGTRLVEPGDSLWRIASADLGPGATTEQIAAAWPDWYVVNRDTIGADPNLLRPGQRLRDPGTGR